MEKTVKYSWPELLKWFIFILLLVSSYIANQMDIRYLKEQNMSKTVELKEIRETQKIQGEAVSNMNGKLSAIQSDVTIIKNAVIK